MLQLSLTLIALVLGYKTLIFGLSLILKRNDIADISWGTSIILIALTTLIYTKNYSPVFLLVFILVLVWGTRLAVRIVLRNLKRKEDFRYKALRNQSNGKVVFFIRSFLQVYILQGILAVVVSLPIILIGTSGTSFLNLISLAGSFIWIVGFLFETVGDSQLDHFKKNPINHGKILMTGLWKYSRHPNYFGEITMWWGIFIISLSTPSPFYVSILGPITITFLVIRVSGIPLLEKHYEGNKEFEMYKKHTNVLIPWFQRD